MKKNTKHILFFILFILLLLLFLLLAGYQCPLRFFLGIPCPFCGMTRAFLCVLEGDLAKSFYFHPLWPIVLGIFIIFPLWKFRFLHLSDKWIDHGAFVIGILFLLCFIIRHMTQSPIVQIDFTKGFFHFLIDFHIDDFLLFKRDVFLTVLILLFFHILSSFRAKKDTTNCKLICAL